MKRFLLPLVAFAIACTTASAGYWPPPSGEAVLVDAGPRGAFGELVTSHLTPRVQIDGTYGALASDIIQMADGAGSSAVVTNQLFTVNSGTAVNGYGDLTSKRLARYRAGQGMRARWTAAFDPGVADYVSGAGPMTMTNGLIVGYVGTEFGVTRRIAGECEIRTLTVTTGSTGAGTIVVTLDGTATNVTIGGALSTANTAETIAQETFTGWTATATGSVVTFQSMMPEALAGAFTFAAGGSGAVATGPTLVLAGAPNDLTDFVAQTDWNRDTAFWLDPSKLNVYEATIAYLGAGNLTVAVMNPRSGHFEPVHVYEYPNTAVIPSSTNPTYRIGWFSQSMGSTTALEVIGASGALFVEGDVETFREPHAATRTATGVSTEVALLSVRNSWIFAGTVNQREIDVHTLTVGVDGSKPASIRVCLDSTLSGLPEWTAVGADSSMQVELSNGLTVTNCHLVAALALGGGSSADIELHELDLRMAPGDTLVVTGEVVGGAGSDISVALAWQEN